MLTTLTKVGRIAALALLLLGATAGNAFATHFRYGTISWVVPPASSAGRRWTIPSPRKRVMPSLP